VIINDEGDVRAWVREASEGKARWVEPALGSTAGLPDCWVPEQGYCVWLELKVGEVKGGTHLCYEVRPEQRRELKAMAKGKVPCGLLIGIKGSALLIWALPTAAAMAGKLEVSGVNGARKFQVANTGEVRKFGSGVNFIFSDFRK
jgi:hypothetical protein